MFTHRSAHRNTGLADPSTRTKTLLLRPATVGGCDNRQREIQMSQAPKFFAAKLNAEQQLVFWNLVNEWGFSGETAYCRIVDGVYTYACARA
jgi:hypothetical protein